MIQSIIIIAMLYIVFLVAWGLFVEYPKWIWRERNKKVSPWFVTFALLIQTPIMIYFFAKWTGDI